MVKGDNKMKEWPVVGGVYKSNSEDNISPLSCSVYAIEKDIVYFDYIHRDGEKRGGYNAGIKSFKRLYLPPDCSPLPDVEAFLEKFLKLFQTPNYISFFALDAIDQDLFIKKAERLLSVIKKGKGI